MTITGLLYRARILFFGDARQRKTTLYMLRMFFRGFNLSGAAPESLGLSPERSYRYGDSGGPDLDVVLESLGISSSDAALDIGCGKGGVMLTMAKYPFSRIDGIELSPKLALQARKFLGRARVRNTNVFCCDAAEFKHYDPYTVMYMYNPFPEVVLRDVVTNIRSSLERRPRKLTIIYYNPVHENVLLDAGFATVKVFDHSYQIYRLYSHAGAGRAEAA
jgi:SAM-dependent methyltransferase